MAYTVAWDETAPAGADNANELDTFIQNDKIAVRERLEDLITDWAVDATDPKTMKAGIFAAGSEALPSISSRAFPDSGIYFPGDGLVYVSIQETLIAGFTGSGLSLDDINEMTSGAGVTIDGLLIKDSAIPATGYPTLVGDSGAGGTKGAVPAPAAGDAAADKFLKADGTWAVPSTGSALSATGDVSITSDSDSSGTGAILFKTGASEKGRMSVAGILQLGTTASVSAAAGEIQLANTKRIVWVNQAGNGIGGGVSVDANNDFVINGVNNCLWQVAGTNKVRLQSTGIYPETTNALENGNDTKKWSLVRGTTVTAGDLAFEEYLDHITGKGFEEGETLTLVVKELDVEKLDKFVFVDGKRVKNTDIPRSLTRTVPVKFETAISRSAVIVDLLKRVSKLEKN